MPEWIIVQCVFNLNLNLLLRLCNNISIYAYLSFNTNEQELNVFYSLMRKSLYLLSIMLYCHECLLPTSGYWTCFELDFQRLPLPSPRCPILSSVHLGIHGRDTPMTLYRAATDTALHLTHRAQATNLKLKNEVSGTIHLTILTFQNLISFIIHSWCVPSWWQPPLLNTSAIPTL